MGLSPDSATAIDEGVGGGNSDLPLQCWKKRGLVPVCAPKEDEECVVCVLSPADPLNLHETGLWEERQSRLNSSSVQAGRWTGGDCQRKG